MTRYIFVTGGVVSSLGKGLAAAALASLLKSRGYSVHMRKFDPYLNIDPGTMSPSQHGEVFVTNDGAETDLDLGHYERFADITCNRSDSVTSGLVYSRVIERERRGDYLGATVQVIPHVTDMIKDYIKRDTPKDLDFMIIEVGGTVGDIEGLPHIEAIRQFMNDMDRAQSMYIHLTLIPYIPSAGELKTKPSQHSVKELQHLGIQPDMLLCRCERPIPESAREKLALFCNLRPERIMAALDVDSIYDVPLAYAEEGLDKQVLLHFGLDTDTPRDVAHWEKIQQCIAKPQHEVTIGIVAKYLSLKDAYKSLNEALVHGGFDHQTKVHLHWISAEDIENDIGDIQGFFNKVDAILVPGGYGQRGTLGKIKAIQFAREQKIPFMGICLGMQLAVVEAAQNLLNLPHAHSSEFGPTPDPVIGLMTEWSQGQDQMARDEHSDLGGTMRLGAYDCRLTKGSITHIAYKQDIIQERHRHRYEMNMAYKDQLETVGMHMTGVSLDGRLPEIMERRDHPWFVCMQFHPEFTSRPMRPSPIFSSFIKAAITHKQG